jgi:hypothetical protein
MSQKLQEINSMFNTIDSKLKGVSNDTEPYNTFRSSLNKIYDYFSVIFVNNKTNNEKYKESVDNLDKPCDCSKYKCKEIDTEENDNTDNIDYHDEIEKIEERNEENGENEEHEEHEEHEENEENEENEEKKHSKILLKNSKIL